MFYFEKVPSYTALAISAHNKIKEKNGILLSRSLATKTFSDCNFSWFYPST